MHVLLTRLHGEVSFETAAALDMLTVAGPVSAAAAATHPRHASAENPQPAHCTTVCGRRRHTFHLTAANVGCRPRSISSTRHAPWDMPSLAAEEL